MTLKQLWTNNLTNGTFDSRNKINMNKLNLELGALVREYRLKADMTQFELAQKLGYESVQFVSLFERGLSKVPNNVIGKLVIILGIPEKKITKSLIDAFTVELTNEIIAGKRSVS